MKGEKGTDDGRFSCGAGGQSRWRGTVPGRKGERMIRGIIIGILFAVTMFVEFILFGCYLSLKEEIDKLKKEKHD